MLDAIAFEMEGGEQRRGREGGERVPAQEVEGDVQLTERAKARNRREIAQLVVVQAQSLERGNAQRRERNGVR